MEAIDKLNSEWDCLLSVYEKLGWQGKYMARKRMNRIRTILEGMKKELIIKTKNIT